MPDWYQDWSDQICIIVAGGPSAKEFDLEEYKGKAKFIVINNSWQLAPWADILLAADGRWWSHYKGAKEFHGMKVTLDVSAARSFNINLLKISKNLYALDTNNPGQVGMGGNSGFYALNLVVQFKCKKIILVGYDMNLKNGMHWHGPHEKGLNNPLSTRIDHWRKMIDKQSDSLGKFGVEVINANQASSLTAYKKLGLKEAVEKFSNEFSRELECA